MLPLLGFLLLPLFGGCVRADFEIFVLPDGSGEIRADVAYSARKWPAMFGDPFASFTKPSGFRGLMPPGFVAWSEPTIGSSDGWRHLRTSVFFDDLLSVVLPARRSDGTKYSALRFSGDPAKGEVRLVADLDSILARPVPLPTPQEMGMDGVSIPESVMAGLRGQMGSLLAGLDLTLRLRTQAEVLEAAGFDTIEDGQAFIRVGPGRGAAAFQSRAGVLVDTPALTGKEPAWLWLPAPADSLTLRKHAAARDIAVDWFSNQAN